MSDKETYHPLFCLTEVPAEYCDELDSYTAENAPWIEIVSNDPIKVLEETFAQRDSDQASPIPFLGSTMNQVYDFYKNHLRPASDSKAIENFTNFTFIVIDEECVRSDPWQCIICCDAPDFGEAHEEVKLKQLRVSIEEAMQYLCALEYLALTPSEIEHPTGWALAMTPGATTIHVRNKSGERGVRSRIATPGESRRKKRKGIEIAERIDAEKGEKQIGIIYPVRRPDL